METLEFWTWENNNQIVGEIYIFKKLSDNEFADGIYTAYLFAFRIKKELQGQGYGTKLLTLVLEHIKNLGLKTATIGVNEIEADKYTLIQKVGIHRKNKEFIYRPM